MTQGHGFPDDGAEGRTEGVFSESSDPPMRGALDPQSGSPLRGSPIEATRTTEAASDLPETTARAGAARQARGPIEPGRILFNLYSVVRLIGKGGMGEVWLVRRLDFDCPRALKLIDQRFASDPEVRARFLREAKAMAQLNHPHAVTVHHMGVTNDDAFIEMELVEGQTLDRRLVKGQPMPLDWTARVLSQLCDVLQMAHDRKIVHRDLKPSNLMLLDGRAPGCEHLKVLDFGIAKILDPEKTDPDDELTRPGSFIGTILYTSPEQATHSPVDGRTDLYTVGVILYELLTGHRPFSGQAALHGHVYLPPPRFATVNPAARVPPEVEAVVLHCLSKDPADRPQSAAALARAFCEAVQAATTSAGRGRAEDVSGAGATPGRPAPDPDYQDLTTEAGGRSVASESTRTDLPDQQQPGYEMLRRIGEGASATVFRARDRDRARLVAIKELRDEVRSAPEFRRGGRFWDEARALARLDHAHLVPIRDVDESRGWIVMDLMRGGLDARLDSGPLRPAPVRGILRQALDALRFLHQRGKIHGAIKPANLLIDDQGRLRLGDAAGTRAATEGAIDTPRGPAKYVAPERLNPQFGPVGPGVDLYGLGFTAFELLIGPGFDRLFPGVAGHSADPATAWLRWHAAPTEHLPSCRDLVPDLPDDLARVIDRLVRKDVAARYPDATSALRDLEDRPILEIDLELVPDRPPSPPPHPDEAEPGCVPPPPQQSPARDGGAGARRSKRPLVLVPLLCLTLLPLGYLAWTHRDQGTRTTSGDEPVAQADDSVSEVNRTSKAGEPGGGQEDSKTTPEQESPSPEPIETIAATGPRPTTKPEPEPSPSSTSVPEPDSGARPMTEAAPPIEVATSRSVGNSAIPVKPSLPPPPPELTLKTSGMTVVLIPAGTFAMGSPEGQGDPNEHPQHEVTIAEPFYMGQTEVTQAQYRRVMSENPSHFSKTGRGAKSVADVSTEAHPVERVSYVDAQEFCLRLARCEGLPEGSVRLPTEAQWEYAARANRDQPFAMGEALSTLAWFSGNSKNRTHPVAQKSPNVFHLFDMAGNVAEWCRDWFAPYPAGPLRDPEGPERPEGTGLRVLRGGSWLERDRSCRPTNRAGAQPGEQYQYFGFRIVLDVDAARQLLTLDR